MIISGQTPFLGVTKKSEPLQLKNSDATKAYMNEAAKTGLSAPIEDSFIISSEARQKLQAYQSEIKLADDIAFRAQEQRFIESKVPEKAATQFAQIINKNEEAPMPPKPGFGKVALLKLNLTNPLVKADAEAANSNYSIGKEAGPSLTDLPGIEAGAVLKLEEYKNQKAKMPKTPSLSYNLDNKQPENDISGFSKASGY